MNVTWRTQAVNSRLFDLQTPIKRAATVCCMRRTRHSRWSSADRGDTSGHYSTSTWQSGAVMQRLCHTANQFSSVQWCGLRPSVVGHDRSETKEISLGLAGRSMVLCCETRSCHARQLEGQNNFSSILFRVILCAWNITTVVINSGV